MPIDINDKTGAITVTGSDGTNVTIVPSHEVTGQMTTSYYGGSTTPVHAEEISFKVQSKDGLNMSSVSNALLENQDQIIEAMSPHLAQNIRDMDGDFNPGEGDLSELKELRDYLSGRVDNGAGGDKPQEILNAMTLKALHNDKTLDAVKHNTKKVNSFGYEDTEKTVEDTSSDGIGWNELEKFSKDYGSDTDKANKVLGAKVEQKTEVKAEEKTESPESQKAEKQTTTSQTETKTAAEPTALETAYKDTQDLLKEAATASGEKLAGLKVKIQNALDTVETEMGKEIEAKTFAKVDSDALKQQIANVRAEYQIDRVKTDPTTQEVQAYVTALGFDAGPIDGLHGDITTGGLYKYANANGIEGYGTMNNADLRDAVLKDINNKIATDSGFRANLQGKLAALVESGDANSIKAAQVVMNDMGIKGENGNALVVDGVAGTQTNTAASTLDGAAGGTLASLFQNAVGDGQRVQMEALVVAKTTKLADMDINVGTEKITLQFNDKAMAKTDVTPESKAKLDEIKNEGEGLTADQKQYIDQQLDEAGISTRNNNDVVINNP